MSRKPFYPFLLATYPILTLYAQNIGQVSLSSTVRPSIGLLLLAGLLILFLRPVTKSWDKAALSSSLVFLTFATYGHLYEGLKQLSPYLAVAVRHRFLLPVLFGGLLAIVWMIRRAKSTLEGLNQIMNIAALGAVALPLYSIVAFEVQALRFGSSNSARITECRLQPSPDRPLPDIYIIIMDAYARGDILEEMHGYDNSPFLNQLEDRDFYVARGSLSNYRHTEMSIASMLNLDYIQSFPGKYDPSSDNRMGVVSLIQNPLLRHELECLDYRTVSIASGVFWTEWRDADYFLSTQGGLMHEMQLAGGLTRFESLFLQTTIARALLDLAFQVRAAEQPMVLDPHVEHRERILYALDALQEVPNLPSPKLTFVHIISPHPPMVFGADGEWVNHAEFETEPGAGADIELLLQAYADQVEFLNGQLLESVDAIIAQSDTPPIIIIQGDHGWADRNAEDKLSILNVYHLPEGGSEGLYPTITPVNSFRHIFSTYFGADFGFLPDASYFSSEGSVFEFERVENTWSQSD